jgi:uncharacterized protein (DUF1015 family)
MATIRSFNPIRPNPFYADQLVFTKPQAESVSGDYTREGGLKPLKTLLETGARLRPETPEGQEMAYHDIKETLQSLLEKDQVYREELPGIYIYEVVHSTYRQTGIWALTDLADYTNGRIKIHELTFADSIRRMKNYRENTGLEGSPILLTYFPSMAVNRIIAATIATQPKAALGNQNGIHRIWKIRERDTYQSLIETFATIETAYLADGHHRIESAADLAKEQRATGHPVYDYISSLYIATDQLRIEQYDRLVIPDQPVSKAAIFEHLQKHFYLREATANQVVLPREPGNFGICLEGHWYHMRTKTRSGCPDATTLQEQVLAPFFGINDPKTDSRLKCAGGEKALEEIGAIFQAHPGAIAFTLCPLTVRDLICAADAGHILPPKSTWIVPKVPYGLLIHQH